MQAGAFACRTPLDILQTRCLVHSLFSTVSNPRFSTFVVFTVFDKLTFHLKTIFSDCSFSPHTFILISDIDNYMKERFLEGVFFLSEYNLF